MNNSKSPLTIFLFPFKFEKDVSDLFTEKKKRSVEKAAKKLAGNNQNPEKGWALETYELNSAERYNEYNYFHPFVRNVIFNHPRNKGMAFLTRRDFNELEIAYRVKEGDEIVRVEKMSARVCSIDLHLFDNAIGLMSITTEAITPSGYDNLLRFNDLARRIYPPFLIPTKDGKGMTADGAKDCSMLPQSVCLKRPCKKLPIVESFQCENFQKKSPPLSNLIVTLLSPFKSAPEDKKDRDEGVYYFTPFTDDRMFVVSCYADVYTPLELVSNFEESDGWYRFVFVDGGSKGISNMDMQRDLVTKHTYTRWKNDGTLYGMTRYSFVALCKPGFHVFIKTHMKTIYYQVALMVLFQRAMLLKFAEDIDTMMVSYEQGKNFSKLRDEATALQERFIKFINKYWFIEITPQEQGTEMYKQWMGLLDIDRLYTEVRQEITDLALFIDNRVNTRTNKMLSAITVLGLPIAVLSLPLAFLGFIVGLNEEKKLPDLPFCTQLGLFFNSNVGYFMLLCVVLIGFFAKSILEISRAKENPEDFD